MTSIGSLFKKNYELFCIGEPKNNKGKGFPNYRWMKELYVDAKLRSETINKLNSKDKRKLERLLRDSNLVASKIIYEKLDFDVTRVRRNREKESAEISLRDNVNGKSRIFVPLVDIAEKTIKEHQEGGYVYNTKTHLLGDLDKDSIVQWWKYTPWQEDLMHGEHDSPANIGVKTYGRDDYILSDLKLTTTGLKFSVYHVRDRNEKDKFEFQAEIMQNVQDLKDAFKDAFIFHPLSPASYNLRSIFKSPSRD